MAAGEAGLSVAPDELSEATEQAEAVPRPVREVELSVVGDPDSDQALTPPNFAREHTLREQTPDLTLQTRNAADQLRAPSAFSDDAGEEPEAERPALESTIRELSRFDREDTSDDEAVGSAELATDANGQRHGKQLRGSSRPPAAASSESRGGLLRRALRALLLALAARLRRFAES